MGRKEICMNRDLKLWSPVAGSILEEFNRIFEGALTDEDFLPVNKLPSLIVSTTFPPSNIYLDEGTGNLHIEAAIAGYSEKEVSIRHENDYLNLELSPRESSNEGRKYVQTGIRSGHSRVRYYVPAAKYDASGILANLKDGILSISVPVRESAKPINILIDSK
jgi:HSP20 family molecular chaperone IbpA